MVSYVPMSSSDYDKVFTLWGSAEGLNITEKDSKENILRYLSRNPGLSWVAKDEERIVGAVLCGFDGLKGFIHHLAVDAEYRRQGIGQYLVKLCLSGLSKEGISKCHIIVSALNDAGRKFWEAMNWKVTREFSLMEQDKLEGNAQPKDIWEAQVESSTPLQLSVDSQLLAL